MTRRLPSPKLQSGVLAADARRVPQGSSIHVSARSFLGVLTLCAALGLAGQRAEADESAGRDEVPVWVLPGIPGAPSAPPLTLREEVCEARFQLGAAEERRTQAQVTFRRARRNDYPRGVERQLLKEHLTRRRRQADEAAAALAAVEARADDARLSWQLLEPCPETALPAKAATSE